MPTMQTNRPATALDILIEGKQLFGKYGQRWTRFTLHRGGLAGQNYCSLGALKKATNNLDAPFLAEYHADRLLRLAAGATDIPEWNDTGIKNVKTTSKFAQLWYELSAFCVPFIARLRWHFSIKPAWCRAIRMAADEQLNNED